MSHSLNCTYNLPKYSFWLRGRINCVQQTSALIVLLERGRLCSINIKPALHNIGLIVRAPYQLAMADVAQAGLQGRLVHDMVGRPIERAYASAPKPAYKLFDGRVKVENFVYPTTLVGKQCVQRFRLGYGAREPVQQKPTCTIRLACSRFDCINDDIVRHILPFVYLVALYDPT